MQLVVKGLKTGLFALYVQRVLLAVQAKQLES